MINRVRRFIPYVLAISAILGCGLGVSQVAHATDPTLSAPVTVTVVDPLYSPIGGGLLNGTDAATCRDIGFSFNAVVFVKYVKPDGSLIGYSNNFDFSVQAINPYQNANDDLGKAWQQRWTGSKSMTIYTEGEGKGPGPVNFSVRRTGDAAPYGQGNMCQSPTSPESGNVAAYAFRNGTDKAAYSNNGSFGLSSLGYTKYSAAFTFAMQGTPKDIPAGKSGKWRQATYTQQPFGETQNNDLNKRYVAIEFKYELSDSDTPTGAYNLVPKTTANPAVAEQSDSAFFQYQVANSATTSPAINWTTAGIKVNAGVPVDKVTQYTNGFADSGASSADGIINDIIGQLGGTNNATNLDSTQTGSGTFPGTTIPQDGILIPTDARVGDKYCRVLILSSPTSGGAAYRYSSLACITVGLKPSLEVYGGDVSVGRAFVGDDADIADNESGIVTSTSMKDGKTYGSWTEYMASAPGQISGFGTKSGLAGGALAFDSLAWSGLTLANVPDAGKTQLGYFAPASSTGTIPDVSSVVASIAASTASFETTLGKEPERGEYVYRPQGDVTINSSTIPAGHSIFVYAPTATITIKGDIHYTDDALSGVADIPQVILIANRIHVDQAVGHIDAWLIASGKDGVIDTCAVSDTIATPLTTSMCNGQLTINGPVMAHQLWLRRTARGDRPDKDGGGKTPAEIVNLRPDVYLWANNQPGAEKRLLTTYTKELSPRF